MVTVNSSMPSVVPSGKKPIQKAGRKKSTAEQLGQTTPIANAVSHSIRQLSEPEMERLNIQYDLPGGSSRKALEEYMDILNQAKREEIANLIGVDIYI